MEANRNSDYKEQLRKAAEYILEHDDFLVMAHLNPDGDAIGSSLAMTHLLLSLEKKVTVANEGESPERFSYLSGFDRIVNLAQKSVDRSYSAVIALDIADKKRFGAIGEIIAKDAQILNIDHHPTNTHFGTINVIQSEAASTTEILYDLIHAHFLNKLNFEMAEALYTGLLTDTGGFRYSNTKRHVLEKAADLLSYGVEPNKVAEEALEVISMSHLELLKRALQNLTFHFGQRVAFISISEEDMRQANASKDDVDGMVSYPRKVKGVEVSALLKEWSDGEVKVSLRSNFEINVAEIAQENGGGGHMKAAGYTFYGTLQEAQEALLKQLEKTIGDS